VTARKASRRSRRSDAARIRTVGPSAWRNYLQRARETMWAMQRCAAEENYVALAAIAPTCAIAAADTIVARVAGVVARDEDHAAAVELLLAHASELEGVQQAAQHLHRLLARKTAVQYGEEMVTASMAQDMLTHAERLLAWVEKQLEGQAGGVTEQWINEQWINEQWINEQWINEQWIVEKQLEG